MSQSSVAAPGGRSAGGDAWFGECATTPLPWTPRVEREAALSLMARAMASSLHSSTSVLAKSY